MQSEELAHHGILGQKWGVRRFQNKDGSLTAAGRQRYGADDGSPKKESVAGSLSEVAMLAMLPATALVVDAARRRFAMNVLNRELASAEKNSNLKKYEKERDGETIDPKSGLYQKNKQMTDEEDLERINPNFKTKNEAFRVNCTACTAAMELRQRGFDVHAGTDGQSMLLYGGTSDEQRARWYKDGNEYANRVRNGNTVFGQKDTPEERLKRVEEKAKAPNSRGEIIFSWASGGGHSMYYKTDSNGKMTCFDGQSNTRYTGDSLKKLMMNTAEVSTIRLDDMEYNYDALKKDKMIV